MVIQKGEKTMVQDIRDEQFNELTKSGVVLVDFWAPWCGPCRMQSPVIETLSQAMEGEVEFYKMNVDEEVKTAQQFGIMSIPTMIVKKDDEVVETLVGYHDQARLEQILRQYL